MARTFELEGYAELDEALSELPKATGRNVLKRALLKAGEPIKQHAEGIVRRRTGTLVRSITVGTQLSRRQKSLNEKESEVEVYVGAGPLVQAITEEFGTIHNRPSPFMRPAFLSNWRKSLELIRDELANEIEKARQRLARKAARLLAKGGT